MDCCGKSQEILPNISPRIKKMTHHMIIVLGVVRVSEGARRCPKVPEGARKNINIFKNRIIYSTY